MMRDSRAVRRVAHNHKVAGSTPAPATRTCTACSREKPSDQFYNRGGKRTDQFSWCKACFAKWYLQRRRALKKACVDYKGGKCTKCGYNRCLEALDFHHRDPRKKDFLISDARGKAWFSKKRAELPDWLKRELDQCDLLCANCHREAHTAPSSSGPGQRVLSSRIVGSNPTGVTKLPFLER